MIKKLINNKILLSIIFCLPFLLTIDSWQRVVLFILGVFSGVIVLILDESHFFRYYKEECDDGNQADSYSLDYSARKNLISRSTLFLLLLTPLSFFVITSTSGTLGKGFVLGLMLGIVQEMWQLKNNDNLFRLRFLSQLKIKLNSSQHELIVLIATGYFLLISVWSALLK